MNSNKTFLSRSLSKITINYLVFFYFSIALVATLQVYFSHLSTNGPFGARIYPAYNNYVLFKNSFFHLIKGQDLYIAYPAEEWDLYKYSPTFSLGMGLLAYLPDFIGLFCWNLINTIPLLIGFIQLRGLTNDNKIYALLFCVIELMGSLQNSQSNGLMAGLLILTFTSLEKGKYFLATFIVVASVYLKIYGGIGFVFFLFYPSKMKSVLYTLFWFLFLGVLPLMIINFNQLVFLYKSWGTLLKADQINSTGISVAGVIQTWFRINISKNIITAIGVLLFVSPLIQIQKYKVYHFRLLVLCSTLIWAVIFNHKAESPTYIISMAGIAIWYFSQPKTTVNTALVVLAFIFTTLASGDLMPRFIRDEWLKPYNIKALFSIIIFCKIGYELLTVPKQPDLAARAIQTG